ncbi:hypothetical protein OC861_005481 [Tilletia horrida]|nr:hypothetical protein OC845_006533 [Tilletia horrida]KAK0562129.1 hypothetical protein OC861_005481 [Tilletia horrida]
MDNNTTPTNPLGALDNASSISIVPKNGLWVPKELQISSKKQARFYCVDSTHRGDMYCLRACLAIEEYPLIIYNCRAPREGEPLNFRKPSPLELYLIPIKSPVGRCSYPRSILLDRKAAKPAEGGFFDVLTPNGKIATIDPQTFEPMTNKINVVDEGTCTAVILKRVATINRPSPGGEKVEALLNQIAAGMVHIENFDKVKATVYTWLDAKLELLFGAADIHKGDRAALLIYRDTGVSLGKDAYSPLDIPNSTSPDTIWKGVYPENDTSIESCAQIAGIFMNANNKWKSWTPKYVLCGDAKSTDPAHKGLPSIHQYWTALKMSELEAQGLKGISARDIETLFMKRAYELGYIRVAIGLRSGVLDMFTFLRVPTVSIQIADLVGGERMDDVSPIGNSPASQKAKKLLQDANGHNLFRRLNVEYVTPRHVATAKRTTSRKDPAGKVTEKVYYNSPFWLGDFLQKDSDPKEPSPGDKFKLHSTPVGPFADPDVKHLNDEIVAFLNL